MDPPRIQRHTSGMNSDASPLTNPNSSPHSIQIAGWVLITLATLTVILMAMHPTSGTHDPREFVARVGRGVPGNAFVHGSLVTIILAMATCFLYLRDLLGAHRPIVRVGTIAMVVGTSGALVAGLVNGFMVPNVAARFLGADPSRIAALEPVLVLAREANATCARVSVVGLSLSAVAWSVALLGAPGWRRVIGMVGLVCGLTPLALHAGEHLRMNVPGYGLFVLVHSVWAAVAGVVLIRHRIAPSACTEIKESQS